MPREAEAEEREEEEDEEEEELEEEEPEPEPEPELELELPGEPGAFDSSLRAATTARISTRGCIRRVNTASSSWWT